MLGSFVQFGLNPILGKWNRWSELISLEERLVGELADEKKNPVIVLVNSPAEQEPTIGAMTSIFPATDNQPELGAVYIAMAPRSKQGYIRIIPTSDLQDTGSTFREFQMYQWTVASVAPTHINTEELLANIAVFQRCSTKSTVGKVFRL